MQDKIYNPITKRYVKRDGAIGRKIIETDLLISENIVKKTFPTELVDLIFEYEPLYTTEDGRYIHNSVKHILPYIDYMILNKQTNVYELVSHSKSLSNLSDRNVEFLYDNKFFDNSNDLLVDCVLESLNKNEKFSLNASGFSLNPNIRVVEYLIGNPDKIVWCEFNQNPHPLAIDFVIKSNKINKYFSLNVNDKAVEFLINNPESINTIFFSRNPNDKAISFLMNNPNYIYWETFLNNINAMKYIKHKSIEWLMMNKKFFYLHNSVVKNLQNNYKYVYSPIKIIPNKRYTDILKSFI